MWSPNRSSNTATQTTGSQDGFLLRVRRDGGRFLVSDIGLGNCYGEGEGLDDALVDWVNAAEDLIEVLEGRKLSADLAAEVRRYEEFLR